MDYDSTTDRASNGHDTYSLMQDAIELFDNTPWIASESNEPLFDEEQWTRKEFLEFQSYAAFPTGDHPFEYQPIPSSGPDLLDTTILELAPADPTSDPARHINYDIGRGQVLESDLALFELSTGVSQSLTVDTPSKATKIHEPSSFNSMTENLVNRNGRGSHANNSSHTFSNWSLPIESELHRETFEPKVTEASSDMSRRADELAAYTGTQHQITFNFDFSGPAPPSEGAESSFQESPLKCNDQYAEKTIIKPRERYESSVIQHFLPDSEQSDPGAHQCCTCGKKFANISARNKHKKVHSRPHHCHFGQCQMAFRYPKDLRRHQRALKHGSQSFTVFRCPLPKCDRYYRGFSRRDACQRHVRTHSGGEAWIDEIVGD